jgi:hypothetical protein
VIDHPFVGLAARHKTLLPLDELLPAAFLDNQARHSVGQSHSSYHYDGHQWALGIDAAAPVSSWRPQLLEQCGLSVPKTWDELLILARRGWVAVPAMPVDCLMNFFMLCASLGENPFTHESVVVSTDVGFEALRLCGNCSCFARRSVTPGVPSPYMKRWLRATTSVTALSPMVIQTMRALATPNIDCSLGNWFL